MNKKWSKREEEFLIKNWKSTPKEEISKNIPNRKWSTIQKKANYLNLKRDINEGRYKEGHISWTKNKKIEWLSELNKERWLNEEYRNMMINKKKGKHLSKETKRKISKTNKGRLVSEETRKKLSKSNVKYWLGKHLSKETKRKLSEAQKGNKHRLGKYHSKESKIKIGIASKLRFKNPKYKEKYVKIFRNKEVRTKIMKSLQLKPNKIENKTKEILNKHFPGEFVYNGDFSQGFMVEGLIPDFINCNGKKQVIEVFGDYWHGNTSRFTPKYCQTEEGRKNIFSKSGYKILIIWEHELKQLPEEEIVNKIINFIDKSQI